MSTNTKLAEALRLAYEALSGSSDKTLLPRAHRAVEQALAAHDAEQAQEPVAWGWQWRNSGGAVDLIYSTREAAEKAWEANSDDGQVVAVCLCEPATVEQAAALASSDPEGHRQAIADHQSEQAAQAVPMIMSASEDTAYSYGYQAGWNACHRAWMKAPAAPAPEAPAKDHRQWLQDKYDTGPGEFWGGHP